jgi:hypothetical protein
MTLYAASEHADLRILDGVRITHGSIPGRAHRRLGRNNQDGVALRRGADALCAVVTDGCSSGAASEVGARLGAAWLASWIPRYARALGPDVDDTALAAAVTGGLADRLGELATLVDPEARPSVVADLLLFTFIAVLVEPRRTRVLALGDGIVAASGRDPIVLEPGPDNAPPYVAYHALRAEDLAPEAQRPAPSIPLSLDTDALDTLVLATDGALPLLDGELQSWLSDPSLAGHPRGVQRRLNRLDDVRPELADDLSVVVLHRSRS